MFASVGALDFIVVLGGLVLVGAVLWYFLHADTAVAAEVSTGGLQQVEIVVRGGYTPASIRVKAGVPVRLIFDRQETSSCSEEVVFGDFNLRTFLPAFKKTTLDITPPSPGAYEFTCGMSMLHGKLIAE